MVLIDCMYVLMMLAEHCTAYNTKQVIISSEVIRAMLLKQPLATRNDMTRLLKRLLYRQRAALSLNQQTVKRRHAIEQHERVTMRTRVCSSGGDSLTSSERKLSRTAALPRMLICLVAVKIRSLSAPQVGQVLASGREVGGSSQSPLCTACIRTPCYY